MYRFNLQDGGEIVNGVGAGFINCLQEWDKMPIAYSKNAW